MSVSLPEVRELAVSGSLRARLMALHGIARRQGWSIFSIDVEPGQRQIRLHALDGGRRVRLWETGRCWHGEVEWGEERWTYPSEMPGRAPSVWAWRPFRFTILKNAAGRSALTPLEAFQALGHYLKDNPAHALPPGRETPAFTQETED